jgi:UDP-4-amino-4,6-dideoxy-N-acetyl-beta-L-altrosamine transaminase
MAMIPYGKQWLDADDEQAVLAVLRSDYLTQGPKIAEFEQALCAYTGARYCVAVANGTAALHLAVAALELPAGSEGITTPNTFVASANAMAYCGVMPRFADIDPASCNIDPEAIRTGLSERSRLLLPVHFAGRAAPMAEIAELARQHDLRVIEDAAHAIGSCYPDGGRVGNCRYADLTTFSFHPVKTITSGEGGAITTNDPALYQKLLLLRTHGIQRLNDPAAPWYYEMQALGFNYRLTDLQAALGLSQLRKLGAFAARRSEIVARYNQTLGDLTWLQTPTPDEQACFHLYVTQFNFARIGKTRAEVMDELRAHGVGSQVHYIPVHLQPWYRERFGYREGDYPQAERYYQRALSLPLYPAMSDADVDTVIAAVRGLA